MAGGINSACQAKNRFIRAVSPRKPMEICGFHWLQHSRVKDLTGTMNTVPHFGKL